MQISIEFSILECFLTIKQFDLLYLELIISGFMFCMGAANNERIQFKITFKARAVFINFSREE